jgi:hypothetical protein
VSDDTKPVTYQQAEANRLADLLVEYYPGDAGWRVLSKHLAVAYVDYEATHVYRAGYDPKPKSKFNRAEDWKVLDAIAEIVAEWPESPLLNDRAARQDHVRFKLADLANGRTSRQMEVDAAIAADRERLELARRVDEGMRDFYTSRD